MNNNIFPNTLVPRAKRLIVYKKVLRLLSSKKENKRKESGLCINLPMVLWGLKHHLEDAPNGSHWWFPDTENMFPEIKGYIISIVELDTIEERIERRKVVLKEIIESLEKSK
jgi:hypothetical protein